MLDERSLWTLIAAAACADGGYYYYYCWFEWELLPVFSLPICVVAAVRELVVVACFK